MIFGVDLKIFAFFILFYFTKQIKIYIIVLFFGIIHELSHLIIGVLLKMKVKKVTLMPVGLAIEFRNPERKQDRGKKIEIKKLIVSLIGPITNLIITFIAIKMKWSQNIIYSNLIIAIFNLIPIYPLDGGRVLKSILCILYNKKVATIYINTISNITLFFLTFLFSILIYYLKNISLLIIIIYLWYLVFKENKINKMKLRLYNIVNK